MTIKKSKCSKFIFLALLFLAIPDFNLIDVLPDFIPYLIIIGIIGRSAEIIPYLQESKMAFKKLTLVSLLKIPSMLFMISNMAYGRDIVPLMTTVFSTIELLLLYSAISNLFSGLYYLGQRSNATVVIRPFTVFSKSIAPESLQTFTYIFFAVKYLLNTISQFALLSNSNQAVSIALSRLFPIATALSVGATLILGICWIVMCLKYAKAVRKNTDLISEVMSVATVERLAEIDEKDKLQKKLSSLTLLSIASIFTLDIQFVNIADFNLLPHFIIGLLLIFTAYRLYNKKLQTMITVTGSLYCLVSIVNYFKTVEFISSFEYSDIKDSIIAKRAYTIVEALSVIESALFIGLCVLMAIGFTKFIKKNTALDESEIAYSKADKDLHTRYSVRGSILFGMIALSSVAKCVNTFLNASVKYIFTDPTDVTQPIIISSPAPWMSTVITVICIATIFYAFKFLSDTKDELKFKAENERNQIK